MSSTGVKMQQTVDWNIQDAALRAPAEVVFGSGVRNQLATIASRFGTRIFVCSDPVIAASDEFRHTLAQLRDIGISVEVFTDIEPELPLECVSRGTDVVRAYAPHVIIGFGGGSTIDIAKLLAITAVHQQALSDFYGENLVPSDVLPVVAVPTTSGTGSEATPVAVVTDPSRRLKVGISSPHLIPAAAVVDPELTLTCPASVTAHSGIDALTHAFEAYTARRMAAPTSAQLPVFVGSNKLTDLIALQAAAALFNNLSDAVERPRDLLARSSVAYGSCLAGIAFGTAGTHLSHALQYPIGELTRTPHGLGVGLLLPYVLEACLPVSASRVAELGWAIGVAESSDTSSEAATKTIRSLVALRQRIRIPHTLAEIGVSAADLPEIEKLAAGVSRLVSNAPGADPRSLILDILRSAHGGHSDIF